MINRLRYRFWTHIADLLEKRKIPSVSDLIDEEPPAEPQNQMAGELRRGVADGLGLPPEAIRGDILKDLMEDLIYISKLEQGPEAMPSIDRIWELGRQLGKTYKSAVLAHERLDRMK